jgi:molecular chaperone DnaK (HSP70)
MSEEDIVKKIEEAEMFASEDKRNKEAIDAKIKLETYISTMRKKTDSNDFKNLMGEKIFIEIAERMTNLDDYLDENPKETKDKYNELKEELESFLEVFLDEFETKLNSQKKEEKEEETANK